MKNYHILQETTDYGDTLPNGVYIFESKPTTKQAKAIGFIPHNTDEVKWFKKGLTIDMRGRTFVQVCK